MEYWLNCGWAPFICGVFIRFFFSDWSFCRDLFSFTKFVKFYFYKEYNNWPWVFLVYRNATFLEPHLQGVRRRDSRSSDSDHDERSTEDDERCLLRSSPRTRLPPPPPPPPDDDPPPLKPREFFERLQTQAMREAQERKHRSRDLPIKDSNQLFRPVDADGSLGDSLSQVTTPFHFSFLQTLETLNHEES